MKNNGCVMNWAALRTIVFLWPATSRLFTVSSILQYKVVWRHVGQIRMYIYCYFLRFGCVEKNVLHARLLQNVAGSSSASEGLNKRYLRIPVLHQAGCCNILPCSAAPEQLLCAYMYSVDLLR